MYRPDAASAPFADYKENKATYVDGQCTRGGSLRGHNTGMEAIGATAKLAAAAGDSASYRQIQMSWEANASSRKAEPVTAWPHHKYGDDGNTTRLHVLQEQENTTPGASTSAYYQWLSSTSAAVRRHPNGLPLRQPTGPLPGMPILTDLVSRYPVKDAPESRVEIALISGQLFINGRLRTVVSGRRNQGHTRSYSAHPTTRRYLPAATRMDPILTVLDRRREEKELARAASKGNWHVWQESPRVRSAGVRMPDATLATQQYVVARANEVTTNERRRPMTSPAAGARLNDVTGSRTEAPTTDVYSPRRAYNPIDDVGQVSKADDIPPEDEYTEDEVGEEEVESEEDTVDEPPTVYQQYSIYQTYGNHRPGIRPSASMPAASRQRHVIIDQRQQVMSSASSSALKPTSHSAGVSRRDAW